VPYGKRAPGDADFYGKGYSLDEMVELFTAIPVVETPRWVDRVLVRWRSSAERGPVRLGGQNAAKFDQNGVRVIINYDLPWKSTAYYPER
jgi:hypothetical protein